MAVDKLIPNDPRVARKYATLNGRKYHYLLSEPEHGKLTGTIFLIHGWPDLSFGWRYQIPFLASLGYRVVALDMMGYGETDAPLAPPDSIQLYGFRRAADDIAELAKQLGAPQIVLGGHDWGGMVVYRTAQWHPELVTHVFSICTPFMPPSKTYRSTQDLVTSSMPQFGYQLQLAGPEVESTVQSREQIKQFLQGTYGGKTEGDQVFFRPETGFDLSLLDTIGPSPLLNQDEIEYYADQYAGHGMHGPVNWYRTREANYEDELQLNSKTVDQPVLFIFATKDSVLTEDLASGMEAYISKLSRRQVDASHWALWQQPAEVNQHIKEWLDSVVLGPKSTL